mgnify:FL=1
MMSSVARLQSYSCSKGSLRIQALVGNSFLWTKKMTGYYLVMILGSKYILFFVLFYQLREYYNTFEEQKTTTPHLLRICILFHEPEYLYCCFMNNINIVVSKGFHSSSFANGCISFCRVFINNVRSFRILSPSEAFQMRDGVGLIPIQRQTSSSSEDGTTQQDSRNPSSVITSTCSFDY